MNRKEKFSLLVSSLTVTSGVLAAYFTAGATTAAPLILNSGLGAVGNLGSGVIGNYLQKNVVDKTPAEEILKNGDLTRAIGKTIFHLCGQFADEINDKSDKKALLKLSATDVEVWENLVLGGEYEDGYGLSLSNLDLSDVSAEKSTQYIAAQAGELDNITTLDLPTWKNIIQTLCDKNISSLEPETSKQLADKLHKEFARALRKVLIEDFASDGKAYASMQFRILSETLFYTKQNYDLNDQILNIVVNTNKRINHIIDNSERFTSDVKNQYWETMSGEFLDFAETQKTILQNIERLGEKDDEILKLQRSFAEQQNQFDEKLNAILAELERLQKVQVATPKGFTNPPREPNVFFVEQSDIFARLDEHLGENHIGYLHGTHGLGKTTTVCEYGFSRADDYEFVFYVLAADNTIINEMAQLADRYVETVGAEDTPEQKAFKLKNYLEENARWEKESKNWLIIFDNLESKEPIEKYFPKNNKGDVLYTCNEKLYIDNDHEVDFEEFSQIEAEKFVYQKVRNLKLKYNEKISAEELKNIRELLKEIGELPLTLSIASIYIKENYLRRETKLNPYIRYLNYHQIELNEVLELVETRGKYKDYKDEDLDTLTAFSISINKVTTPKDKKEKSKIIAELAETFLNLLVFCSPENIPDELIEKTLFGIVDISSVPTPQEDLFDKTINLLTSFDLIKIKQKPFRYKEKFDEPQTLSDGTKAHWAEREIEINVFDTYRTLQNVLSVKLEDETKKSILINLINTLCENLSDKPEYFDWDEYKLLAPHTILIISEAERAEIYLDQLINICNNIAYYLINTSQYEQVEKILLFAISISENLHGIKHTTTATMYNNLGQFYDIQGEYEEAESLYNKALEINSELYGEDHFETAVNYNNLAEIYISQGKLKDAESYYRKALKIHEAEFGENHEWTATGYFNLAKTYVSMIAEMIAETLSTEKNFEHIEVYIDEALKYSEKSLSIRKKLPVKNPVDIAKSYANLAKIYLIKTRNPESIFKLETSTFFNLAELHLRKSLQIYKNLSLENSQDYASSLILLGDFYHTYYKNRIKKALQSYNEALIILQNIFRSEHAEINNVIERIKTCENDLLKNRIRNK